ncbi:MAG: hypothetical protein HQ534_02295 [Armatimonadetes bacterium]|nr:hypothetical protein [Armatimonadota bacterium]
MKKMLFISVFLFAFVNFLICEETEVKNLEHPIIRAQIGQYRTIYTKDDNIFHGKITEITEHGEIVIQTEDGMLTIPSDEILEESVKILRKDGSTYKGKLIGEDDIYVTIESKYGIVTIDKGEIEKLDRYFGGKLEKTLQKKIFFTAEEQNTEIFRDPTAYILSPYTFFITGFSMGYGFSDKFHLFTRITNNFNEDLNLIFRHVLWQKIQGAQISNFSIDFQLFSNHDMNREYALFYEEDQLKIGSLSGVETIKKIYGKKKDFFWEGTLVYSSRKPLKSGRGNWGFHTGITINKLLFEKPKTKATILGEDYTFDGGFSKTHFHATRLYVGMDYDLTKRVKFISVIFYDPSNHYVPFGESISSYFENDFLPDNSKGQRKEVDFDFGITYAANDVLRIGFHFQRPYITLYWKFYDY